MMSLVVSTGGGGGMLGGGAMLGGGGSGGVGGRGASDVPLSTDLLFRPTLISAQYLKCPLCREY